MKYTVDYFISKFENIPEHLWTTGTLEGTGNRHCCLGHCGMTTTTNATEEAAALAELVYKYLNPANRHFTKRGSCDFAFYTIFPINDKQNSGYQQPTPKKRILAALHDIKKMQEKEGEGSGQVPSITIENNCQPSPSYPDLTKRLAVESVSETLDVAAALTTLH